MTEKRNGASKERACEETMRNRVRKSSGKTAKEPTTTLQQLHTWPRLCSFIGLVCVEPSGEERDMNGTWAGLTGVFVSDSLLN